MPRIKRGVVVSDKAEKTVIVAVNSTKEHPIYRKKYKITTKFAAHDESGAKVGDTVEIVETRPLSRTKHWLVQRKIDAREIELKG